MNQALVDTIVQAVLYEGYILYPYRASAKKNRQRFTFGRVYPEAYSVAQKGAEPCLMQTELLVETEAPGAGLEVIVRFLHPMAREIGSLKKPLETPPDSDGELHFVPELQIGEHVYQAWQEAVERVVRIPTQALPGPASVIFPFSFPDSKTRELIFNDEKKIAAVIVRRQEAAEGTIEVIVEPVDKAVSKITVRIRNTSAVPKAELDDQKAIIMRTFTSTHTILHTQGDAAFLSQIDPPAEYAKTATASQQIGTWPILVGDEEKRERDTMISSPIILYDYPKIAPESPGNLFDGGEIDEILTLRIMTMTEEEKREMRRIDGQAREILERTENLPQEALLRMHGAMRETAPTHEQFFNPDTKPTAVSVAGVALRTGDRVRVRPKSRADIMDMAFDGKIAIIETIEQDAEDKIHLALILEDDPGKDLGFLRQPGHRFFYGADEIEPLKEGE